MSNDDEGRRQIGFRPPGSEEQSIVPMVSAQTVQSLLDRAVDKAFWVGLAIGAVIVFLLMRPSAPTA